jgi:hypothetical protein
MNRSECEELQNQKISTYGNFLSDNSIIIFFFYWKITYNSLKGTFPPITSFYRRNTTLNIII